MTTTMNARGVPTREQVAELVRSAAAGDQRSWDALVRQLGGLIWAVARAHRLSDADAGDVAQTTWVRLFEHLDDLKDPGAVAGWLATTARRECLRILRDGVRHVPFEADAPEQQSPDTQPAEELLLAERDRALWRGFERLQASDQALLRLLTSDPRPAYKDIAAALNIPIGSIGPTRARALERLRRELDRQRTLTLLMA